MLVLFCYFALFCVFTNLFLTRCLFLSEYAILFYLLCSLFRIFSFLTVVSFIFCAVHFIRHGTVRDIIWAVVRGPTYHLCFLTTWGHTAKISVSDDTGTEYAFNVVSRKFSVWSSSSCSVCFHLNYKNYPCSRKILCHQHFISFLIEIGNLLSDNLLSVLSRFAFQLFLSLFTLLPRKKIANFHPSTISVNSLLLLQTC